MERERERDNDYALHITDACTVYTHNINKSQIATCIILYTAYIYWNDNLY